MFGNGIYDKRVELANLDERLAGKSTAPPYISEPVSEDAYRNVITGLEQYLTEYGSDALGGAPLGSDNWPTTQEGFVMTLENNLQFGSPGSQYNQDVAMVTDVETNMTHIESVRVQSEYMRLTKLSGGEIIEDASRQIEAMDATREMQESWTDLPPSFTYSNIFLTVEGFKVIQQELFMNVGLPIGSVAIIVLLTVASFTTALLITLNVGFCIIEILRFMWALGIAIDSVSVINIVLSVGLSVDYCAHVGHAFMVSTTAKYDAISSSYCNQTNQYSHRVFSAYNVQVKGGNNKDRRVTETLADVGAAVLNGATSTFLAVAVLLGSSSYVFKTLSAQFAVTVGLGVIHGLVLLPVMLSLMGPRPFSSAEELTGEDEKDVEFTKKADLSSDENDSFDAGRDVGDSVPSKATPVPVEANAKATPVPVDASPYSDEIEV
jgi:Niemann-Pick C1 protein